MGTKVEVNDMNVGTMGHVDHGKTTLTAAITKIAQKRYPNAGEGRNAFKAYDAIDNAPEERNRGITINASHVAYYTARRKYSHTDCPGHEDYVKNAIVGVSQMDTVILTVAGPDGVMPQTMDHMRLARTSDVQNIIVFINKVDIMRETVGESETEEMLEMVKEEIRGLIHSVNEAVKKPMVDGWDPDKVKMICGSAHCALQGTNPDIGEEAVGALLDAMDELNDIERDRVGYFRMPISGAHTISGRGTVVSGCIGKGAIKPNDQVEILGGATKEGRVVVCTSIEADKVGLPNGGVAGQNVGLLLRGVARDEVERGMVCCTPGSAKASRAFTCDLVVTTAQDGGRSKPFSVGYTPQFYLDAADVTGAIVKLPDGVAVVNPGDAVSGASVVLMRYLVLTVGVKLMMREGGVNIGIASVREVLDDKQAVELEALVKNNRGRRKKKG